MVTKEKEGKVEADSYSNDNGAEEEGGGEDGEVVLDGCTDSEGEEETVEDKVTDTKTS